jgi:hypothetical protein
MMKKVGKPSAPRVSVVDAASGTVTEMKAPGYGDPAATAFWKPVAKGFKALLKRRGLETAAMIGVIGDLRPSKRGGAFKVWAQVAPDVPWVMHSHQGQLHRKGYSSYVYHLRYPVDPAVERLYGWKRTKPCVQVSNLHRCWRGSSATHVHGRLMPELVVTGGAHGIGRIRGDLWSIVERFQMNNYGQLSLDFGTGYEFLQPGAAGSVPTITYEVFREGIQETEARTFIEKALVDGAARRRLGGTLAARCQDTLDTRLRYMLWTGLHGHGNTWGENLVWKTGSPRSGKLRKMGSRAQGAGATIWGGMGHAWYDTTGWQDRSKELFEAAAEVARALSNTAFTRSPRSARRTTEDRLPGGPQRPATAVAVALDVPQAPLRRSSVVFVISVWRK